MFKFILKLGLFMALVLTASVFASGGKAAAADPIYCPGSPTSVPSSPPFGYNRGEHDDGFGGMAISARIGSQTNGNPDPHQDQAIDTSFKLNSQLPGLYDPAHDHYYNPGGAADINARIFKLNDNNPYGDPDSRTSSHTFNTNTNIYTSPAPGNSHFACKGWTVLGPGATRTGISEWGNRWALDCGQDELRNGTNELVIKQYTHFWLSNIPNYNGNPGYWEIQTNGKSYVNGSMDFNHSFNIINGQTQQVRLIWHAQPQPPKDSGQCVELNVNGGGYYTTPNGKTWETYTYVRVTDSTGHELVHGDNGDPYSVIGPTGQKSWTYKPKGRYINIHVIRKYKHLDGSTWVYTSYYDNGNPQTKCYSASCNMYVDSNVPGATSSRGQVLAGSQVTLNVSVTNLGGTPSAPNAIDMPSDLAGHTLRFNSDGANQIQSFSKDLGDIYKTWTVDYSIPITIPGGVNNYHISGSPVYDGLFYPEDANCGADIAVYQAFSASLSASSDLSPTIEHPSKDTYQTSINVKNDSSHAVNIPTNSSFYYKPIGGGQNTIASNSGGTYPSSPGGRSTNTLSGTYTIPPGYQAGDVFCATIHANYTTGFVGPGGDVLNQGTPADNSSCPRVVNEPYFKVYNSNISAGGAFNQCLDKDHGGGGILAGYADISDPPGVTRGSSTQLSALALLKITGVASAKTSADIGGSPTKLSFANSGVQVDSGGNESPVLGGQYGGCRTLTNETAPPSAANYASATFNLAGKNGAYKHTGKLTINGGTLATSKNVSVFTDGDVYISSPITYGNGWQAGTAPSLVVHASGNIYIAPGVTKLAGLYIAQDSGGSGGKIYTCADNSNHFSPMSAVNLYDNCKNQLIVTGSFVANQVNLMRTFGSLRDEEPNSATSGTPDETPPTLTYRSCGTLGHPVNGEPCPANLNGLNCISINEPSDSNAWQDNQLCTPNSSDLHMAWTYRANGPDDASAHSLNYLKTHGYPYCVAFNAADSQTWDDNWLCLSKNFSPTFTKDPIGGSCTKIVEVADTHDNQWRNGYNLCLSSIAGTPGALPSPTGPPYTGCSNKGTQADDVSCSSEIFEYSPTLYLSRPAVNPPGGGSIQFQSITGLPPVL